MAHPSYLALVADLDDSRQLAAEARSQVQRSLLELSRKSQSWLGALPVAGPEVVSGDRMQALFPCPARRSEAERVAAAIADTVLLWAAEARRVSEGEAAFSFGLGCGSLSTAIDADRIGRMDGPCFHRAETALVEDAKRGKRFSIVAVAEGAMDIKQAKQIKKLTDQKEKAKKKSQERTEISEELAQFHKEHLDHTVNLTRQLEQMTRIESRLTILGHLQRGGTPSAADRVLATRLGTACADFIEAGTFGCMVAARGSGVVALPLEEVAGQKNLVPLDHTWIKAARSVGTCLGD